MGLYRLAVNLQSVIGSLWRGWPVRPGGGGGWPSTALLAPDGIPILAPDGLYILTPS